MTTPLQPGPAGWTTQNNPPLFDPDRGGPLDWTVRHIPAALRVWGSIAQVGPPRMNELSAFSAVRLLTEPRVRGRPTSRIWNRGLDGHPDGQTMVAWLRCMPHAEKWWRSRWGWRAPREFVGWRDTEGDFPHLEPDEVATMRLPEDVVMDADVVLFQAWCQGFTAKWLEETVANEKAWGDWRKALHDGLTKLCASPFARLAFACPFLPPIGLDLGPGLVESAVRMQVILKHPYTASLGELEMILPSPYFAEATEKARKARKGGRFVNPDGGWYACGNASALGTWFRRGARWTANRRGAR